jgi:hypothetical protein
VLGHLDSHQVVVGAEICFPQPGILLQEVGVDGHHRDGRGALLDEIAHRRRVGGRDRDRGHPFGQQVVDDLHLAGFIRAGGGACIEACIGRGGVLLQPFLATEIDLLEERVVEPLYDDGEGFLALRVSSGAAEREHCRGSKTCCDLGFH